MEVPTCVLHNSALKVYHLIYTAVNATASPTRDAPTYAAEGAWRDATMPTAHATTPERARHERFGAWAAYSALAIGGRRSAGERDRGATALQTCAARLRRLRLRNQIGRAMFGLLVLAVPLGVGGCFDPTGPVIWLGGPDAYVLSAAEPVDVAVYRDRARTIQLPLSHSTSVATLNAAGDALLSAGSGGGDLTATRLESGRRLWSERLGSTFDPRFGRWDSVSVSGQAGIAETADGTEIFIGPAFADSLTGTEGVAVLDSHTRDLRGFIAPFFLESRGLSALPPTGGALQAMAVVGRRDRYPVIADDWLYIADPAQMRFIDSSHVDLVPGSGQSHRLYAPQFSPSSSVLYLVAIGSAPCVIGVDWPSLHVMGSVCDPSIQKFAISPDGTVVVFLRNSNWTTDVVHLDAQLHELARLNLGMDPTTGLPAVATDVAVNRSGTQAFVIVGTGSLVVDQPGVERGRMYFIDVTSWTVSGEAPLGVWGPSQVIPAR